MLAKPQQQHWGPMGAQLLMLADALFGLHTPHPSRLMRMRLLPRLRAHGPRAIFVQGFGISPACRALRGGRARCGGKKRKTRLDEVRLILLEYDMSILLP